MSVTRLSTWCALACKTAEFQRFLEVDSEAAAIDAVRTMCGVASRAEFDKNPEAKARFDALIRLPYADFTNSQTA